MSSFVWVSRKPKDGVATLYESNITLNKAASSYFEEAFGVLLGLDEVNKKIALKPISEDDIGAFPKEKRHKITVKSSYARVSNKKFMKQIADLLNITLGDNSSIKFKTKWSNENSALVIDLNKPEV